MLEKEEKLNRKDRKENAQRPQRGTRTPCDPCFSFAPLAVKFLFSSPWLFFSPSALGKATPNSQTP
ncbi:MAG: hypothetical protein AVDCRST_MAG56-3276 [uncultured Cytophagales bacterium]|uniref:Uncharacterized protein n=1 Tax=uncultured Cytophagales bacterium TaxID=158755 RepID=A0A6J4JER9_9SPHI|nr:MAG: hypothetical protein AVDCRST_MAG56-3276 [uncultured Cytophagales bacterium]